LPTAPLKLHETLTEERRSLVRWIAYWERQPAFTEHRRKWMSDEISKAKQRLADVDAAIERGE
jgi:hypothetical protein